MIISNDWKDYEILDMASGEKLERWGNIILIRPDPQIIWKNKSKPELWKKANAHYHRSKTGGGEWEYLKMVPESWQIQYKNLTFNLKPMGFKHTGLFPEQAVNWDFMMNKIKNAGREIKVLNLFAYTGGATCACSAAGASVCHVDSSKGMTAWAKENIESCGLKDRPVRFIVDDVIKFVQREIRRGNKYDAIVMDPPSYGRGANGEVWNIEESLYTLVELCTQVLSDRPLFFLINSYTTGLSPTILSNILSLAIKKKGKVTCGEVGLPMKESSLVLPCGIYRSLGRIGKSNERGKIMNIIYEDNHIIVVEKPVNVPSQADNTGDKDMLNLIKDYIKEKYNKPGNVYLGLVHRLDRPVGGIMVFAKTSKAASRLSESIRTNEMHKTYLAVVNGHLEDGEMEDFLFHDETLNTTKVVSKDKHGAKIARLSYKVLEEKENLSLVQIALETGRHHQIRVQFASRGHSLYGDQKYGKGPKNTQIALWAYKLSFKHPVKDEIVEFECRPKKIGIWSAFSYLVERT